MQHESCVALRVLVHRDFIDLARRGPFALNSRPRMPKKGKKDKKADKKAAKTAKKEAKVASNSYSDFDMPPEEDDEDQYVAPQKNSVAASKPAAKPAAKPAQKVAAKEYVKASGIKPVDVSTIRKAVVRFVPWNKCSTFIFQC